MAYDVVAFFTNQDGVAYPNSGAVNASGPAATDGTELVAGYMNNYAFGRQQALLNYAGLTPTGVVESNTVSQELEAIEKGMGVGPGMSSVRYINASPAVNGDRTLILAEQGVLIASYPELDAKTWITGNTAAQIAAAAAGEKFYRSSDAGGATGDAAGPYLQLPAQPSPTFLKQYSEATGDFTVTPDAGSISSAIAVPYKDTNGSWYVEWWINASAAATATLTLTLPGITMTAQSQYVGLDLGNSDETVLQSRTPVSGTTMVLRRNATTGSTWTAYAKLRITAKPTWADDFEMPWCITY